MRKTISRRDFLKASGAAALGASLLAKGYSPGLAAGSTAKHVLRIAHMTDVHILPDADIIRRFTKALRTIQSLKPAPDVLFNTGDCVMDSLYQDKTTTLLFWEAFNRTMTKECRLPTYSCIGNHDVWGWGIDDPELENDPLFGKGMPVMQLKLSGRYYSFDLAGWHFIVLDSTHLPNGNYFQPYIGKLDEEQFDWLTLELNKNRNVPVCILSHIPILSAAELFDGPNEESGDWVIPAAWVHIDARRFRDLFLQHPNVKLCLDGHEHQQEEIHHLRVEYFSDGAICGAWWNGAYLDCPPGFAVIDLFDDGSSTNQYMTY
jgi:Icc protein